MKRIEIEIEGTTPLLMHRFTDQAAMQATSGTTQSITTDHLPPREAAEEALYVDEKGKVIIPQPNLFRCIIDAGKFFKIGSNKITTQKTSYIPGAAAMNEIYYPLRTKNGWKVDTRPVRIPKTGGRILRHRPCFDDWGLKFEVELEETIITEKLFREIIDAAGKRIGLGDFRPDCKGPFGKFKVKCWEVKNGAK